MMKYDDACGAYSVYATADGFKNSYGLTQKHLESYKSFNIRPTHSSPVVIETEKGRVLENMRWGLVPSWSKDIKIGYKLFNARDDKVFTSPVWRGIYKRRALVPATGYFEWTKTTPKHKFFFHPKQTELFSFAGIYDVWHDAEGKEMKTYTIITTEPNKETAKVHDRMPVILHKEDENQWLDNSITDRKDIEPLIHPLEDGGLDYYEVSNETKSFAFDDPGLIKKIN